MNTFLIIVNLAVFLGLAAVLFYLQKNNYSFTRRVFVALLLGALGGVALQLIYGPTDAVVSGTFTWVGMVSTIYVRMLQMIVMPLIAVSIVSAIVNLKEAKTLGKYGITIIAVLIITTAISAVVGIGTTLAFGLDSNSIARGASEEARMASLEKSAETTNSSTIASKIVEVVPTNIFNSLSGNGSNATIAVVVFSMFVGVAALGIRKKYPEESETFVKLVNALQQIVMRIVSMVLKVTPYGILALMARFLATSKFAEVMSLGTFIIASYVALALIVVIHMVIVFCFKMNPFTFIKKSFTVLMFAFTSRSSASAIPLTIKTQEKKLGVPEGIASLAASFGASIGQNGCAGMYPAMLAVMIAPTVGIDPLNPIFIIELVIVVAISSFGVAGVGGGATFAALIVLSSMNLPVALAGLLISIEPLIDMGRTLVNVSDALVAGVVTAKVNKELDEDVYNAKDTSAEMVE